MRYVAEAMPVITLRVVAAPANYLIFHPERSRIRVKVSATALVGGFVEPSWQGAVWVDRPPHNEDPFVLGPTWVYSYCHATQLRRRTSSSRAFVRKGSCIIFCSGDAAEHDRLVIDTVFWVGAAYFWRGPAVPPTAFGVEVATEADVWKYHLRFAGMPAGHSGFVTYEAALYPEEPDFSYLPLGAQGQRVEIVFDELSETLQSLLRSKLLMKRPVELSAADLEELLERIRRGAATAVVRDIRVRDAEFAALRGSGRGAGCRAQPSLSRLC